MDKPTDLRRAPPPRPSRSFALLWLAAILVPLLGVAGAGLASWRAVEAEAGARIERTVELLRQNALRGFGAQEAILAAAGRAIAGRPAEALRDDFALHALLADLAESGAPVINGVLVADAEARIISASWEFPARPVQLADRDYVRALLDGRQLRAVGEPVASRPMGWPIIPIARRVALQGDPEAPALLVSSFSPDALSAFYASVVETPRDVVTFTREDGIVLARFPPVSAEDARNRRAAVAEMVGRLLLTPTPSWATTPFDARQRLLLVRRVGDWPVVIAYGLDRSALVQAWRQRMVAPVAGGLAAMGLLLALTATALRAARQQREQAESRAEAEAQLARAGRAAAIGLLAAGLAHDVKNLVQAVRSGTRVMQRRAEDPAEVRRCAELLGDAAERGGKLVDAMLAFARGGAEPDAPAPPFGIEGALDEVAALLTRSLGSPWKVRLVAPPGLPAALGDRAGFEAAVVNLAANARDAMPDGGTVTISAWAESLAQGMEEAGLRPGAYVVTAVRDTGLGMDEGMLARLEEPFFTTKAPGLGAGLGLATVRGFCARSGGALRIESLPGRGTTAAIWLPAARP